MTELDPRPYANTDERGGFSNDDDNIRQQQAEDIADPNQDVPLLDPGAGVTATPLRGRADWLAILRAH